MQEDELKKLKENIEILIAELETFRSLAPQMYKHGVEQRKEIKRLQKIINNGRDGTSTNKRAINITTRIGAFLDGLDWKQKDRPER